MEHSSFQTLLRAHWLRLCVSMCALSTLVCARAGESGLTSESATPIGVVGIGRKGAVGCVCESARVPPYPHPLAGSLGTFAASALLPGVDQPPWAI